MLQWGTWLTMGDNMGHMIGFDSYLLGFDQSRCKG